MRKAAAVRELKDMTADELLSMPYIEYGEPATEITIPRGALGEIRRRLKMNEKKDVYAAPLEIDSARINELITKVQEMAICLSAWPSPENPLEERRLPDELVLRQAEVLAQLYQAQALNEIAQSLYEIVRDGIGVKRDDDQEKNRTA